MRNIQDTSGALTKCSVSFVRDSPVESTVRRMKHHKRYSHNTVDAINTSQGPPVGHLGFLNYANESEYMGLHIF